MAHRVRSALLIVFLWGALAGLAGCGSEIASPSGTQGPSPTRSGSSSTAPAVSGAAAISDYGAQLNDWAKKFLTNADVNALNFENPQSPTKGELGRAKDFAAYAHTMLSDLRKIEPPLKLAQAHRQYVDSIAAEVAAFDRLVLGIESGNQRDIQLAFRDASAARTREIQALDALGPYIDSPGPSKN